MKMSFCVKWVDFEELEIQLCWRGNHFFWWCIVCQYLISTKKSNNDDEYQIDFHNKSEILRICPKLIDIQNDNRHKSEYEKQKKAVDSKKYEIHYQEDKE